jgi:hypothetical protein
LVVSITFLRSPVFAIFAIMLGHSPLGIVSAHALVVLANKTLSHRK